MNIPKIELLQEKLLASSTFALGAGNLSAAIDTFANWLLGGFGAGLALLLANIDKMQGYIATNAIRRAGLLFLAAVIVGTVEKLFALVITTASKGYAAGREMGAGVTGIDLQQYFKESERAFYFPARWFAARSFRKVAQGDIVALPRALLRAAQIQTWIALAEAGLIIWAIYTIIHAL